MPRWTAESILELSRAYQPTCVLAAAADLGIFDALAGGAISAVDLAGRVNAEPRAMARLLDALAALELVSKRGADYSLPAEIRDLLTESGAGSVLQAVRHQANCLRRWVQLPVVVQTGQPAQRIPSIRGEAADQAAFIGAMHTFSGPNAARIIGELGPLTFRHLLDVGGGSGTWTIALLERAPEATGTMFDLPEVVPLAAARLASSNVGTRVTLVAGDFYVDPLPEGADLVWLSAIAHQSSRDQNRALFRKIYGAMAPEGALLIRDIIMDEHRVHPVGGALFAINMLTGTQAGGTYTLAEFREDLEAAGFRDVHLLRRDEWMDNIIRAEKTP